MAPEIRITAIGGKTPVPCVRIASGQLEYRRLVVRAGNDGIRDGYRKHGIVRKTTSGLEKPEFLGLDRARFSNGSDDISGYCT